MRLHHHLALLSKTRTQVLRDLVLSSVKRGDRVLDAGTGTGILAIWAAQAGADKVVAVDAGPLELARDLAEANSVSDRIEFIQADLTTWTTSGKYDVLTALLYENDPRRDEPAARLVSRLAHNYLRPDGTLLPDRVRYWACLEEWPDQDHFTARQAVREMVRALEGELALSLEPVMDHADSSPLYDLFPLRLPSGRLSRTGSRALSAQVRWCELELMSTEVRYPKTLELEVEAAGIATALVWAQDLMAVDRLVFRNESVSWLQAPIAVQPGETLVLQTASVWRANNTLPLGSLRR